jgi:predicted nucleotidyltransferase
VQSADFFAQGAIDILAEMGANELIFGSESDLDYNSIVKLYEEKSEQMEIYLKNLPENLSYPEKTQLMWQEFSNVKFDGNTPNHVLALAYAKASAGKNIKLRSVQRNNDFHSADLSGKMASATAIRANIKGDIWPYVPENLVDLYHEPTVTWDDLFSHLKYKIISQNLQNIFQVNQEMESRIKKNIKNARNFEELVEKVHTKRYTKARVRRILTYILLNFPREIERPQKIHVLGFTARGQKHLVQVKEKCLVRIGKEPWDNLTQIADDIYQLGNEELAEQNHGRKPLIIEEKMM